MVAVVVVLLRCVFFPLYSKAHCPFHIYLNSINFAVISSCMLFLPLLFGTERLFCAPCYVSAHQRAKLKFNGKIWRFWWVGSKVYGCRYKNTHTHSVSINVSIEWSSNSADNNLWTWNMQILYKYTYYTVQSAQWLLINWTHWKNQNERKKMKYQLVLLACVRARIAATLLTAHTHTYHFKEILRKY